MKIDQLSFFFFENVHCFFRMAVKTDNTVFLGTIFFDRQYCNNISKTAATAVVVIALFSNSGLNDDLKRIRRLWQE